MINKKWIKRLKQKNQIEFSIGKFVADPSLVARRFSLFLVAAQPLLLLLLLLFFFFLIFFFSSLFLILSIHDRQHTVILDMSVYDSHVNVKCKQLHSKHTVKYDSNIQHSHSFRIYVNCCYCSQQLLSLSNTSARSIHGERTKRVRKLISKRE